MMEHNGVNRVRLCAAIQNGSRGWVAVPQSVSHCRLAGLLWLLMPTQPRLAASVYTDAGLLPLHSEVLKLKRPSASQMASQKIGILEVKVAQADPKGADRKSAQRPLATGVDRDCPNVGAGGEGGIRTHGALRHA